MGIDRIEVLKTLVEQNPADSRTRYMLAMELTKRGDLDDAVGQYRAILAGDADYVAAYYHGGQALERLGRPEQARELYRLGIEACTRTGDQHTRSELQDVLDNLG